MSTNRKHIVAILSGIVIATGSLFAVRAAVSPQKRTITDEIPQPSTDHWISFDADLRIYHTDGANASGRFYRTTDGSTRMETGPEGQEIQVIAIKNVPRQIYYVYSVK